MHQSHSNNTWNHQAQAHLGLGLADFQITRKLQSEGIKTILLVDADLIVDVGNPERQLTRFKPLFSDLGDDASRPFAAGVARFFNFALFASKERDVFTFGESWYVAPSHFSEVVSLTNALLDEVDTIPKSNPEKSTLDIEGIKVLLDRLIANPWANIDSDLSKTLTSLGVIGQEQTSASSASALVQWIKKNFNHAIGISGGGIPDSFSWPLFDDQSEKKIIGYWRGLLRDYGNRRHAIENDAFVLAALSILNRNWRALGRRVILLTGSTYILRAVINRPLYPFQSDLIDSNSDYGTMMSDFIRIPSCVVASSQLWNPVDDTKESGLADLLNFPLDEPAVEARRMFFSTVCYPFSKIDLSSFSISNSQFSQSFSNAISELQPRFATNLALQQLINDYTHQVKKSAIEVNNNLESIRANSALIDDTISARGRIDILESLIFSAHYKTSNTPTPLTANKLRSPPFVDLSGNNYTNLRELLSRLSESEDPDDQRINDLKLSIYKADKSTYMLVLVYATHYAHQGRWTLASSAAQYAYQLSQTRRYTEESRPVAVFGEEAALLELACRRRGATDVQDVAKALTVLSNYEMTLQGENLILTKERLRIERSSLCLTSIMIRFFLHLDYHVDVQRHGISKEFRQEVLSILTETVDLLDEFLTRKSLLLGEEPFNLSPAEDDLYDRLLVNVCNLGWLLSARTPASISSSRFTGITASKPDKEKYDRLYRSIEFCAKSLKAKTDSQLMDSSQFNWLSWVMCSLMLGLDLDESPNELAARSLGNVRQLSSISYEHPYDNKRVQYSLEFMEKFHS